MNNRFETRKLNILAQLETPDGEYQDLSPKGSVDESIRGLIDEINTLSGLVTTSSCSGRISVFLEGRKASSDGAPPEEIGESRAGPGGKGVGGAWLFISHEPVKAPGAGVDASLTFSSRFGLDMAPNNDVNPPNVNSRYIHLKFEPMHVLTAALSAGFRESGAVSLGSPRDGEPTPMVAVRSTGYSFDSFIGYQDEQGRNISLVNEKYLENLIGIANDRFRINTERIARFRTALMGVFGTANSLQGKTKKPDWEDADARRQRKREEGLARQMLLRGASEAPGPSPVDLDVTGGIFTESDVLHA
ncbi:hypothetical protein ACEQ8H_003844 [Pleosporales sp. CAS-2024a]